MNYCKLYHRLIKLSLSLMTMWSVNSLTHGSHSGPAASLIMVFDGITREPHCIPSHEKQVKVLFLSCSWKPPWMATACMPSTSFNHTHIYKDKATCIHITSLSYTTTSLTNSMSEQLYLST